MYNGQWLFRSLHTVFLILHARYYKDHLVSVDGLFGFNLSSPSYDGVSHTCCFLSDTSMLTRAEKTEVAGSETEYVVTETSKSSSRRVL